MTQEEDTQDFLAHYGVVGMKWGKSRAQATGRDIRLARANVQIAKSENKKKVNALYKTAAKGKTSVNQSELKKVKAEFLNNPDRVTAARLTRGEALISGLATTIVTGGLGAGVVVGGGGRAINSGVSRTIERRQETGYYNK